MFRDDVQGFVKQSVSQARWYSAALFAALGIAMLVAGLAYGAYDVMVVMDEKPTISIEHLVVSRLAFAFIMSAAMGGLFWVVKFFARQIVDLHAERRSLHKLSVVARDVTDGASHGLDLTPAEKLQARMILRMSLIREHLARDHAPGADDRDKESRTRRESEERDTSERSERVSEVVPSLSGEGRASK